MRDQLGQFEREVYELVRQVPAGRVTTYGAIAAALGKPLGARQVGWVLNKCFGEVPPVPAHRVVNRLGLLTGAAHFPEDRPMHVALQQEGIEVESGGVVAFEEVFWDPNQEW